MESTRSAEPLATDATPDHASSRSAGRRLLDVFVSPGELFASFGPSAPWVGPLIVATLLTAAAAVLIPAELYEQQIRDQLTAEQGAAGVDPESMAMYGRIFGVLGTLIAQPLMIFLSAAILLLFFRVGFGGEANFRQHLAVSSHAAMIPAVGALLTVPLQIARGDVQTQLSLSLLTPFLEADSILFRVLNGISVFSLWWLVVLALGASIVNRRPSWGISFGVLFAAYLLVVVGVVMATA